ncbi:hypothetical protein D3C71_759260 [compost metagenome]
MIAKHLTLVAPLPDRDIAHGVDHHTRRTQVTGLDVRQLRHACSWCLDQRHRVVVQPDRLLLRLPGRRIVANPLPAFVIDRDLCTATGRRAQHALTTMVVAVTLHYSSALLHRTHAVGIVVGKRLAANAGGVTRGILVARSSIHGNQAMAVSRIGIACGPGRGGQ